MLNLTKNQIYIISAIILGIIVYFMFFRKKTKTSTESNYYGDNWGWQTGPQPRTREEAMRTATGTIYDSVAGTMESGYDQDQLTGGAPNFESNYSANQLSKNGQRNESNYSQEMLQAGSATNFLG